MNKLKPRIYFLIEVKKREFESRIYFATKAASLGFSVVIAKKSAIFDRRKNLQRGLIIFKSIGPNNIKAMIEYKKLGYTIGTIDEEGMMFFSEKHYCASRSIKNLKLVDIFFCWGKKEYSAIINNYPEFKNKIFITGNQRIDILKNKVNQKYLKRAKMIKKEHGNFILFTTMFTLANSKMAESKDINRSNIVNALIKKGWSEDSDYVRIMKDYIQFQKENIKLSINFIKQFPINFPNKKMIIRPHPNEKTELWFELAKNLKNVNVIFDDESTCPWIKASNFLITSNCTTSVESFMLGKKSINFVSNLFKKCQFLAPKMVSENITSLDQLNNVVEKFNPSFEIDERKNINKKLAEIIYNCSNENCSAENMLNILGKKLNLNEEYKKDKFDNVFCFYFFQFYYLIRFYYRKFFTKQDKALIDLITQKLKKLYFQEIVETVSEYSRALKIDEKKLKIKEIYPQVFIIEGNDN